MDGWEAIATFALAATPGIIVLEILEFRKPHLRERNGLRAVARYLIVSAVVWVVAAATLKAHQHLASVIDSSRLGGDAQVTAYVALAWRLGVAAVGLGVFCRIALAVAQHQAFKLEQRQTHDGDAASGGLGGALIQFVSIPYAWDALMQRLRRRAKAQVVHVRLKDGSTVYGVLAGGGFADFQADGRGLVLDVELLEIEGQLIEVPGSTGIFIVPESVATVAFLDFPDAENGGTVES